MSKPKSFKAWRPTAIPSKRHRTLILFPFRNGKICRKKADKHEVTFNTQLLRGLKQLTFITWGIPIMESVAVMEMHDTALSSPCRERKKSCLSMRKYLCLSCSDTSVSTFDASAMLSLASIFLITAELICSPSKPQKCMSSAGSSNPKHGSFSSACSKETELSLREIK